MRIRSITVFAYRKQSVGKFATSRGAISAKRNFLVRLTAIKNGELIYGWGESAPRGSLTGDSTELEIPLLDNLARCFSGFAVACHNQNTYQHDCLAAMVKRKQEVIHQFRKDNSLDEAFSFAGTSAGFENAYLDLASQFFEQSGIQLLGGETRDEIQISAITTGTKASGVSDYQKNCTYGKRYTHFRFKADQDQHRTIGYIESLIKVNKKNSRNNPIWVDFNECLTLQEAKNHILEIIQTCVKNDWQGTVLIEQPVRREAVSDLVSLQNFADSKSFTGLTIALMADESLCEVADYRRILIYGQLRAYNIKIFKTGGVISAVFLARLIKERQPDAILYFGGMLLTSEISAHAMFTAVASINPQPLITSGPGANFNLTRKPIVFSSPTLSTVDLPIIKSIEESLDFPKLAGMLEEIRTTLPESELFKFLPDGINMRPVNLIHVDCMTQGSFVTTATFSQAGERQKSGKTDDDIEASGSISINIIKDGLDIEGSSLTVEIKELKPSDNRHAKDLPKYRTFTMIRLKDKANSRTCLRVISHRLPDMSPSVRVYGEPDSPLTHVKLGNITVACLQQDALQQKKIQKNTVLQSVAVWCAFLGSDIPLIESRSDIPLRPASLVKLLTVLTVLELINNQQVVEQLGSELSLEHPQEAESDALSYLYALDQTDKWPGTTAGLRNGDIVSINVLLMGLGMASANECGRALARIFGGCLLRGEGSTRYSHRDAHLRFVDAMRDTLREVDPQDEPLITTPIGGDDARISARDLAKIVNHAIKRHPRFPIYFASESTSVKVEGANVRDIMIKHTSPLIGKNRNLLMSKTGTTKTAGGCLVSLYQQGPDPDSLPIIIVSMCGDKRTRFDEHEAVIDLVGRYPHING